MSRRFRLAPLTLAAAPALLAACTGGGLDELPQDKAAAPAPRPTASAPAPAVNDGEPDARGMIFLDGFVMAVAREGDTLDSIARRTGADPTQLAAYNGLPSTYRPRAGDEIVLPPKVGGYARSASPVRTASTAPAARATSAGAPLSEPAPASQPLSGGGGIEALPSDGWVSDPAAATAETAPEAGAYGDADVAATEAAQTPADNGGWSAARIADAISGTGSTPASAPAATATGTRAATGGGAGATGAGGGYDIVYHEVAPGESADDIARRYKIDVATLAQWNALSGPGYRVTPGQVLTLPVKDAEVINGLGDQPVALPGGTDDVPLPAVAEAPLPRNIEAARPIASPGLSQYQETTLAPAEEAEEEELAAAEPEPVDAAPVPQASLGGTPRFLRPVPGPVAQAYDRTPGAAQNDGVDFDAAPGEPVQASADGEVALVSTSLGDWGSIVLVRHSSEFMTVYGRLGAVNVRKGQKVKAGERIGQVATPAGGKPARMHFEVRRGAFSEDPEKYF